MPRTLLFVAPSLGGGGAEAHLVGLVHGLRRVAPGVALTVAVASGGGVLESRLPTEVELRVLATGPSRSASFRTLQTVAPLRRLLRELRPDGVCALQDQAAVATLLAVRGLRRPPPVVVGVQNTLSHKYSRRLSVSRLLFHGMARLYPRADLLITPSQGVADDLRHLWPDLRSPIEVVANAVLYNDRVELSAGPPGGLPRPRPPLLVLACGRLVAQKGFAVLLDAFARLPADRGAHLWILGEGPLRGELAAKIDRLGLAERVWLAGFHPDPRPFFAAADLFVLSSLWEGFANVVVEALAAGTPVVTTRCPHGPAEILEQGACGRLVPPDDPQALARVLVELLDDPDQRAHLTAVGLRRAGDFSASKIAARYLELLRPLVGGPP